MKPVQRDLNSKTPHLKWFDHNTSQLEAVFCHGCGAVIMGWIDSELPLETRVVNNQTVIIQRVLFAQYPTYAELEVEMDDKSHHVMAVCQNCKSKASLDQIEKWYGEDVEAFKEMAKRSNGQPSEVTRKPVKVIK